jgi:hypothetical protein
VCDAVRAINIKLFTTQHKVFPISAKRKSLQIKVGEILGLEASSILDELLSQGRNVGQEEKRNRVIKTFHEEINVIRLGYCQPLLDLI